MKPYSANALTFLAGVMLGSLTTANVEALDNVLNFTARAESRPESPPEQPPGTPPLVNYCDAYPAQCDQGGECPPIERDPITGRQIGGCMVAEYVCCQDGLGCWGVLSPTDCGNASLYWLDCASGEQLYDPVTGEASVICHD